MATVTTQVDNVITRIKKDPNVRTISRDTIVNFLNEAQDIVESRVVLPNMQQTTTIDLVADTQSYSLASDIFKPLLFRHVDNDWVMKQIPFVALQKRFSSSTGTPQEYAVYGGSVYFYPTPSSNDTAGVRYYYLRTLDTLVESSAGTDEVTTSQVPANFHWVLERGAEMLAFQMLGYPNRAQQAEMKFEQGIMDMQARYSTQSDSYENLIFTEEEISGERHFLFDPYQT